MIPSFAIVGAVNHGKSSLAATLAENDQIGISDIPGETRQCTRFEYHGLFEMWDTPGFQDPCGMLREIGGAASEASDPVALFREFVKRHSASGQFEAERELLRPLFEGAGIVYVLDTSRPLTARHRAEMELLRLTGLPRLVVLNATGPAKHEAGWRKVLGQFFGVIHEFNAHSAGANERAVLLRKMAEVSPADWAEKLAQAADAIESTNPILIIIVIINGVYCSTINNTRCCFIIINRTIYNTTT